MECSAQKKVFFQKKVFSKKKPNNWFFEKGISTFSKNFLRRTSPIKKVFEKKPVDFLFFPKNIFRPQYIQRAIVAFFRSNVILSSAWFKFFCANCFLLGLKVVLFALEGFSSNRNGFWMALVHYSPQLAGSAE